MATCTELVKRRYKKWPSARASQAVCKCRKARGRPCKGKKLRQWEQQKWINTRTGKPCGTKQKKRPYCRPTRRVGKTPTLAKDVPNLRKLQNMKGRRFIA